MTGIGPVSDLNNVLAMHRLSRPRRNGALRLGEQLFDRVQVARAGRQIEAGPRAPVVEGRHGRAGSRRPATLN
jgi:hypothetical protein